ncbi:uncharacterized protein B0H18DRAFT_321419 [Fomitopsis serialis]|uniref:uncharacterized protein n=1 Tax=Fomitopsis serialis TaxID=139415 RepID=UPI0020081B47|nr:uncharacterized protein B0H18DRAFT_321419 [Neoantrodia serialis]KAH9936367.1 hypothetical protein B0H18DRAFT_321419 [Neoantrodia serialis]
MIYSKSQHIFKRVAAKKIRHFALDLCFVSLGIRTGYLFDAFAISGLQQRRPALFIDVLASLRQVVPALEDVIILHEPISDQLFFVNFALLEARCARIPGLGDHPRRQDDPHGWPFFVQLSEVPTLVEFPTLIASLLREVCARGEKSAGLSRPIALTITQPLDVVDLVPLAAALLEYPVAYVPADADQTAFLTGVPLDVYDCVVSFIGASDDEAHPEDAREHTLLKFSSPSCLSEQSTGLLPAKVMEALRDRFGPRLNAAEGQWSLACGTRRRHTIEYRSSLGSRHSSHRLAPRSNRY